MLIGYKSVIQIKTNIKLLKIQSPSEKRDSYFQTKTSLKFNHQAGKFDRL